MASTTARANIPQEFYDWTSAKLLVAPEPQYVFADLILRALGVSLAPPSMVGLPGRAIGGQGADYTGPAEDRLILEPDVISESLFAARIDFKGQPGTTVRLNRPSFTDSTYTMAARRIPSQTTISTEGIRIASEQAVLTLDRYAGPYDNTAAAVRPYVAEAFDAQMGVHNLVKMVGTHLVRDFHKFLDTVGVALGMDASSTLYPVGMTAANDATDEAQYPLDYETLSRVAKTMDESNLPVLPDGRRVIVVTPTGLKQLKDSKQFALYSHDFPQTNPLFRRYTGLKSVLPEWYVFVSNTLDKTANTSSVPIHSALAFAPGALGIGMGRTPAVVNNTNDNYGESVPVIWRADLAFALLDSRFAVKVSYTADVS
jgi:hypothetical protein